MTTIEANKAMWDGEYNWHNQGDEWSAAWGGPFMQWYGTILPRIKVHVPTNSILEIACGFGRWTQYLKDLCKHLIVIDLSEECIEGCKRRFSKFSHLQYYVNDGRSLDMIADGSVDFVFSFDSLVHADESVIEAYLSQLPRILSRNGAAFIHHSNLAEYRTKYSRIRRIPKLKGVLSMIGILDGYLHLRDWSVGAKKVEELAQEHGLGCISQEIVLWGTERTFIDCMSTIIRSDAPTAVTNRRFRNPNFMQEARNLSLISELYSPDKR